MQSVDHSTLVQPVPEVQEALIQEVQEALIQEALVQSVQEVEYGQAPCRHQDQRVQRYLVQDQQVDCDQVHLKVVQLELAQVGVV